MDHQTNRKNLLIVYMKGKKHIAILAMFFLLIALSAVAIGKNSTLTEEIWLFAFLGVLSLVGLLDVVLLHRYKVIFDPTSQRVQICSILSRQVMSCSFSELQSIETLRFRAVEDDPARISLCLHLKNGKGILLQHELQPELDIGSETEAFMLLRQKIASMTQIKDQGCNEGVAKEWNNLLR